MDMVKYNTLEYWKDAITEEEVWTGPFKNLPITEKSLFIHSVIVNCNDADGYIDAWACFPDIQALLGFIEYVFLPTAFSIWLNGLEDDEDEEEEALKTAEEILDAYVGLQNHKYKKELLAMRSNIAEIDSFWDLDDKKCLLYLEQFAKKMYSQWAGPIEKFFYFHIFKSPVEIGKYVVDSFEEDKLLDIMEEDMGLTKKQWEYIYNNIYHNEKNEYRFFEILNDKLHML